MWNWLYTCFPDWPTMVQQWQWDYPFKKFPTPSMLLGETHNSNGEELGPKSPPEYFADVVIHHRKKLTEMIPSLCLKLSRFVEDLPSLNADTLGQKLPKDEINRSCVADMATWFKAILKSREGELLQFDGSCKAAVEVDGGFPGGATTQCKGSWHVQYAQTWGQKNQMVFLGMPGTGEPDSKIAIDSPLDLAKLRKIGSTTVCIIDGQGNPTKMREAKVVTWPQLFLLGATNEFTAQEVFAAGWQLERIMTERVRPGNSDEKKAANILKKNNKEGGQPEGRPPLHVCRDRGSQKEEGSTGQWWNSGSSWNSSWNSSWPSW